MMDDYSISRDKEWIDYSIKIPEWSDWKCYLFGGKESTVCMIWQPEKGNEPNWFWRKMQYLFFGNRWVKEPEKKLDI
jgi:hypothetical protein